MNERMDEKELLLKGKKRALRLLERKDYSRKELIERLLKDGYMTEQVEQIIDYVDSFHYLDDIRVAGSFIRGRKEYKSKRELEYLLKQKGISEEEIELAMEENYKNEDGIAQEELAIQRNLNKYHINEAMLEEMTYEEKQKIAARLYRKGFGQDKIRKMLLL
ncbi:MAG: RecX family transcriptional regulator [Lachnospiraceae bacterium]|nr:RecX family transcriptional regulator [Lachnospiraceae bacterium]